MSARLPSLLAFILLLLLVPGQPARAQETLSPGQARALVDRMARAADEWESEAGRLMIQGRALSTDEQDRITFSRYAAERLRATVAMLEEKLASGELTLEKQEQHVLAQAEDLARGPAEHPGPVRVPARAAEPALPGQPLRPAAPPPAAPPGDEMEALEREAQELDRRLEELELEQRMLELQAERAEIEREMVRNRLEMIEVERAMRELHRERSPDRSEGKVAPGRLKIKEQEPMWVLAVHHSGPMDEIDGVIQDLMHAAEEHDLPLVGPCVMTFLGGPEALEAGDSEVEVAFGVAGPDLEGWATKRHELKRLPAQKVLSLPLRGPYEQCFQGFPVLFDALKREGLQPVGPLRALYLDDPEEVPAEKLRTELQIPIR